MVFDHAGRSFRHYTSHYAASAAWANCVSVAKKAGDWPTNRPVLVRKLTAPSPRLASRSANDRADREFSVQENRRLGHDQIRREGLAAKRRGVQIRKHQSICRIGQWRCIARFVLPGLKLRLSPLMKYLMRSAIFLH
jgi:hypothetical protein